VNSGQGTVSRIDERTERVATTSVGPAPQLVAFGGGAAWVTVRDSSQVVRVDPAMQVTARVPTATNPFALAWSRGVLYVASLYEDVVQAVTARGG
jgi:hypothetical protein